MGDACCSFPCFLFDEKPPWFESWVKTRGQVLGNKYGPPWGGIRIRVVGGFRGGNRICLFILFPSFSSHLRLLLPAPPFVPHLFPPSPLA